MARSTFSMDVDSRAYMQAMRWMQREAIPEAVAETINTVARAAHNASERNIKKTFTLRNAFTLRGLTYWQARPRSNISRIDAVTGHRADYMAEQEAGFTRRARRRRIPVPTRQARIGKNRTRVIAKRYRMNRMSISGGSEFFIGRPGGNRNKKLGIYHRMRGGLRLVRDLSVTRYTVRRTNWHSDAVRKFGTRRHMAVAWQRAAQRRLSRVSAD